MSTADTAPVRDEERVDLEALSLYLHGRVPGADGALELEQFPHGHSNLTYLLRCGGEEYVLRRPPLGPLPPRAHDMIREGRLLERVAPFYPPAPRPLLLCEDSNVIGAPFYLMERRRGVVARNAAPAEHASREDFPRRASEAFIDALAELHSVDIERHQLGSLGKPDGFLARQVQGWSGRWMKAKIEASPAMETVSSRLLERLPKSQPATLVHNDFKLDNTMFDASDPGRVVAVFDWEMSSVGDPLVDLGVMLCYWPEANDPPARRDSICPLTSQPGWPRRAELLDRYHRKTGRDLAGIAYYETFGLFKLAVVLQQIYYRFHMGQTSDKRFRCFDERVRSLAESALARSEDIV